MSIRYPKNISNPTKSQTPNMSLKGISSNGFSKWINHHPASGDMLEDHLSLCNSKTNVVITSLYVFAFAMILRIFSMSQGCHIITIHLYSFICKRCRSGKISLTKQLLVLLLNKQHTQTPLWIKQCKTVSYYTKR